MSEPPISILIYGLGAIGSFYAFILQRSPTVSVSVVARSNYDAVKANGIVIHSKNHGDHHFRPHAVYRHPREAAGRTFDYVVVANKAVDLDRTARELECVVEGGTTTIVIMQNGVGNEDYFHAVFPNCVVLSGVIWVGATQTSPGVVTQHISESTTIGISHTRALMDSTKTACLESFVALFSNANHPFTVEQDIRTAQWKKCIWNAAWNSLTTLTGMDTHTWLSSGPVAISTTRRLMHEAINVAIAVGVPGIDDTLVDELINRMVAFNETVWTSMYHDARAGRALEVEVIVGSIVQMGRNRGVRVDTLETLYALLLAVDLRLARDREGRA